MFTGLIRGVGTILDSRPFGGGLRLTIDLACLHEAPEIGASIAVNGTCLTVTSISGSRATFDAVTETIARTTLASARVGAEVNLEPALRAGEPLDGHLVLGHVDDVGRVLDVRSLPESWIYRIALPESIARLVAKKGSIAIDGISLTVADIGADWFTVSVIPHTRSVTTLKNRAVGDAANLEVDVLARYAARILGSSASGGLSESFLRENGFA